MNGIKFHVSSPPYTFMICKVPTRSLNTDPGLKIISICSIKLDLTNLNKPHVFMKKKYTFSCDFQLKFEGGFRILSPKL